MRPPRRAEGLTPALPAALAALALALGGCSPSPPTAVRLTAAEVFEMAKPAVVIVEMDNAVTWSVPQPVLTPQKTQQLQNRLVAMVRAGQVANNDAAIGQAAVKLLTDDPAGWFTAGAQRHQHTDSIFALGSGFFVTEDGYLLTNDHVVDMSTSDVSQQLLDELQREGSDPSRLASFRDEMSRGLGVPVGDAPAAKLFQWTLGVYKADLRVVSVRPTYRIGFGSMSATDLQSKGVPVELVTHGQTTPGRDVALLKAAGGPYVSLAVTSSEPARGSALDVIGYPCRCASAASADLGRVLAPVLTQGTARERLPMAGGWTALGTDASVEHGNSGGPVLNDAGQVVGLATFTDAAATAGTPRSFAVPMDVARQFTDQAHVRVGQGALGKTYAQAISEFRQQHFRAALPLFQKVAAGTRASNPYVPRYMTESQSAIAAGRDRTPSRLQVALPYVAVAVYVLLSAAALAALLVYRRRRRMSYW